MIIFKCLFGSFFIVIILGLIISALKDVVNKKNEKLTKLIYLNNNKKKIIKNMKIYNKASSLLYHYSILPKKMNFDKDFIILLVKKFKIVEQRVVFASLTISSVHYKPLLL